MKKKRLIIYTMFGIVPMLITFLGGYKASRILFEPSGYFLNTSSVLSQQAHLTIANFCEQIDVKKLPLQKIAYNIKERFPIIESVTIHQQPTKTLDIRCCVYTPLFNINHDMIVCASGILEPSHSFKTELITTLPALKIDACEITENRLHTVCYDCLASCPSTLFDVYDLTWKNEAEIVLTDKKQGRFSILSDINTINDQKKFNLYAHLKHDIMNRNDFALNKGKQWVADIRFDNQIIIFSRGGRGYGYKTS